MQMASFDDLGTGLTEAEIAAAREAFLHDCPTGYCSKRKFLTWIRKTNFQSEISKKSPTYPFKMLFARQNYRQSRKFFSAMFDIYDKNHDGVLDINEYLYAFSAISGANRLRTVETLYNFFDTHQRGYITREEFNTQKKLAAQLLGQHRKETNDQVAYDRAFDAIDLNRDGRISKDEFIQWYLADHSGTEEMKPLKKRGRILKNISTFVDRGQIKTSQLQQQEQVDRLPINALLRIMNQPDQSLTPISNVSSPISSHVDRYLTKVIRQARHRFLHYRNTCPQSFHHLNSTVHDNLSDSGVNTQSPRTYNDELETNTLLDIDEDSISSIFSHDSDRELLCQSLEAALMETIRELRLERKKKMNSFRSNTKSIQTETSIITRL